MRLLKAMGLAVALVMGGSQVANAQPAMSAYTVHDMYPGMTMEQVIDMVGRPEAFRAEGQQVIWTYLNRCIRFLGCGPGAARVDLELVFVNGALTSVLAGEVRQSPQRFHYLF